MNILFLIEFALQIIGWLGPVIGLLLLGLRLGLPLGRGIGIRRIAVGAVTLVVAMLMRVFWMVTFEPASAGFDYVAHGIIAVGLVAVVLGSRTLIEQYLSDQSSLSHGVVRRLRRRLTITALSTLLLLGTVDAISPGPMQLEDTILYATTLSLLLGIEWHIVREILLRMDRISVARARWALIGAVLLPVAGVAHILQMDAAPSGMGFLTLRLLDGFLLTTNAVLFLVFLRSLPEAIPERGSLSDRDLPLSLSRQLVQRRLVALLALGLVVVSGGGVFVSEIIRSNIRFVEQTVLREQGGVARSVASNLTMLTDDMVQAVGRLAEVSAVRRTDVPGMREAFRLAFARWGNIATHFSRIDEHGRLVYTYPEMLSVLGADLSSQPHVRRFLDHPDTMISDIFAAVQGHKAVAIYAPVKDAQGRFAGGMAMLVRMNAFSQRAFRNVEYLNPNPVVAVNTRGFIIAGTDSVRLGHFASEYLTEIFPGKVHRQAAEQTMATVLTAEGSGSTLIGGEDDPLARRWVVTEPVSVAGGRWGVVMLVVQNADLVSLYQGTVQQQFVLWLLFTGLLLFMMGAIAFVFYRWSRFLETEVIHKLDLVRLSEGKYRELFEESRDAVYMTSADGRLLDINPAGVHMFGYKSREEMFVAGPVTQYYMEPPQREQLLRILQDQGFVNDLELNLHRRDGSPLIVRASVTGSLDATGRVRHYRGILRDITQQKQMEEEMRQAQKMESVGLLAGGVAHDFNNLLGGVLGYASYMKSKLPPGHAFIQYLETIERSAQRAAELTSKLLAFARGGQYEVHAVGMNAVIQETVGILARSIDKSISVETSLSQELPSVEGDAGQLQQVMMNLCLNARDAMPSGGHLKIRTATTQWSSEEALGHAGARPGRYVVISVQDTGTGMDPATRQRIFEPFFTTKGKGKGTGLGLSMVYGIVRNHHGYVSVESQSGKGSTFTIHLPASERREDHIARTTTVSIGGNERILVADDERDVSAMMRDVLSSAGYAVETVSDGEEALVAFDRQRPDLVILDMIMPHMGGVETFDALVSRDPRVRVLLVTGYSQDGKAQEILRRGAVGFLQKPFVVEDLLKKVRSVLDA